MTARERLASPSLRGYGIAAALAVVLFILAYNNGAYAPRTQATAGVLIWWAILLTTLVGLVRAERLSVAGRWVAGALGAFAAWTLASALWSSSAEASVAEFNRTILYLGVFLLVALLARRGSAGSWADGLAIGISAIAFVALASRLFPTLFSEREFLPSAQTRLSFPLGYWNGLGIFCALAVPLLLRCAVVARSSLVRGLALAPIPVIVADIYLASSRGAIATLLIGTVVLLTASNRRPALIGAVAVATAGSAVTVAVLLDRTALVDGPLGSEVARSEGRSAALAITLVCLGTAAAYAVACRYWPSRLEPSPGLRRIAAIATGLLTVVLVIAAHPVQRFQTFKQLPQQYQPTDPDGFTQAHLLSGNGSGRWSFWASALDEWSTRPWTGRGAGSYESWWSEHGTLAYFVKDAHSLWLETLGELGAVGFVLLVAVLLGGAAVAVAQVRQAKPETRVTNAALLGVLAAFAAAAAVDWVWELTIVSVVAFICLALIVGAATTPLTRVPRLRRFRRGRRQRVALGLVLIAVLGVASEGDQMLAHFKLQASQSANARHDYDAAFSYAVDARDLQPWAAAPYLQMALIADEEGEFATASRAIVQAIERAPDDWDLWFVRARIEARRGRVIAAVRSFERSRSLNPRSPLFANSREKSR